MQNSGQTPGTSLKEVHSGAHPDMFERMEKLITLLYICASIPGPSQQYY